MLTSRKTGACGKVRESPSENKPGRQTVGFVFGAHQIPDDNAILAIMNDWQQFKDPALSLVLHYPEKTLQGDPVDRTESRHDESARVHLISRSSRELYVEVTKYRALPAQEEYSQHRRSLGQRFSEFKISELKEITWKSMPAYEYAFEWNEGARSVILVERNGATYRFLYDPLAPLNLQVLSTVEWTD